MLSIHEELFLLALDDRKGTVIQSSKGAVKYGLAGAILADLALRKKVQVVDKKLVLLEATEVGDEMLDEALQVIGSSKKARMAPVWINILGEMKLIKRVARKLEQQGIIRIEEKRYFWVIPYEAYPQKNANAKFWVKQHLREVVLAGEKYTDKTVVLLSLLEACHLTNLVFTRDERKAARKQIEAMTIGEDFGFAVSKTLEDIETAAAAAAVSSL